MGLPRAAGVTLSVLVICGILLAFTLPPAHAQSFSVATNKDVYGKGERVLVAGALPDEGGGDVVVQVKKDDRQCALQILKAGASASFVSRPLSVGNCGPGEYAVVVRYLGSTAETKFIVAGDSDDSASGDFRTRAIKNFIMQAQERATEKVREVIGSGIPLPQQAAEPYQAGMVETSLALQAVEYGDAGVVQAHQSAAFAYFRQVIDALSSERLTAITQAQPQYAVASEETDRLAVLQDLYKRLVDLAEKNNQQQNFEGIADLLSQAKALSDNGDAERAKAILDTASKLLDQARIKLVEKSEASTTGARLTASADKLESRAADLLKQAGDKVAEKVQEALSLIDEARSAIAQGDYDSARDALFSAAKALSRAE